MKMRDSTILNYLLLVLFALSFTTQAEVYQWKDEKGKTHFSDKNPHPDENTSTIKIQAGQSWLKVKTVYDGDTVVLENGEKIRLLGINTPEIQHQNKPADAGGDEAKQWLINKVKNAKVRVETDVEKQDHYGRTLGHLFTENKEHLNLQLVKEGLAAVSIFPPSLRYTKELIAAQDEAEQAKRGIWQRPEYAPINAADLTDEGHAGWTRIVGTVSEAQVNRKTVYLRFTDRFLAKIERDNESLFPDLNSYRGKKIEVRGWLNRSKDKFSMLIRHPSAIKLLQ